MAEHTPTPWTMTCNTSSSGTYSELSIVGPQGQSVLCGPWYTAAPFGDNAADPEFIVRACNAHDDLLAALKMVEWGSNNEWAVKDEDYRMCPACDQVPRKGHATDCLIGNAIAKAEAHIQSEEDK